MYLPSYLKHQDLVAVGLDGPYYSALIFQNTITAILTIVQYLSSKFELLPASGKLATCNYFCYTGLGHWLKHVYTFFPIKIILNGF